jgi:hypothetical protein
VAHTTASSQAKLGPEDSLMGVSDHGAKIKLRHWTFKVIENKPQKLAKEIRKELENTHQRDPDI